MADYVLNPSLVLRLKDCVRLNICDLISTALLNYNTQCTMIAKSNSISPDAVCVEQHHIPATDGYPLSATLYQPLMPGSDVLILNSGTGVRRQYYAPFAEFFARHGFSVITYDYRGIGDSLRQPLRSVHTSLHEWGEKDFAGILDWTERELKAERISVVGHSGGGKIPGFTPENRKLRALAAIAVPNSYWGFQRPVMKLPFAALVHLLMPLATQALSYFPAKLIGIGENYPRGVALEWARWSRHKDYIFHPRSGYPEHHFSSFTGAVVSFSFADDLIASKTAVGSFLRFYHNAAQQQHRHIIPADFGIRRIGHSGFFRPEAQILWQQLFNWLYEHHNKELPVEQSKI